MNDNLAAVLVERQKVRIENRPRPRPDRGEALIEVLAVGVCGSDVHYFQHGRIGEFVVEAPLVLGHEASGRVFELGDGVTHLRVGQRVAIEPGVPCSRCAQCRAGRYNLCPEVRFLATPPVDGAFTQYLVVSADFAHPIPDSVSDNAGALIEPLSVALWANDKAKTAPGSRVLITGAGPIGLLCALVARARGAVEVLLSDIAEPRLAGARTHGFQTVQAPDEDRLRIFRPDTLIECSGSPAATASGMKALQAGGGAVLVGMSADGQMSIPTGILQNREITLTGTFRYANVYPSAIELVASGKIDLDSFVSREYSLGEVEDALTSATQDAQLLKVLVHPQAFT